MTAAVSLQIIHESNQEGRFSPEYGTKFYGYNGQFRANTERWARKRLNPTRGSSDLKAKLVSRNTEDY